LIELLPSRRQLTPQPLERDLRAMVMKVEEREARHAVAGVVAAGARAS
jgi:hypothetical protein